ncbi:MULTISPECIES: AAA-like domain-containing protein [unclassified Nodularia (in: cyanobacteria)]|uniref:AAA-like domain-containing protein n=1 Tax=unclassified Nodularia (in: cyanobacteria) TaxID=2656917 RepID=UPI001880208B|nr:AAA-like domain-containing protein [Nodularia sp. LEGE 06071]MBE9201854.1 AAA-like domain-containing protein [Nodularia sp. LEGE 06071]MCC2693237.1 AAA-like domain-containing protein [Nodularia sp. LEGE 04288]
MKKILILSANPTNTSRLRLDEEVREIQAGLERSQCRDQFTIISKWAVRPDDLRRSLLDYQPQIVHFSGHGAGEQGLVLESKTGDAQLVNTDALARLFKLFQDTIECVLLNACYSEVQAEAIFQHIDCVVGMNQAFGDKAAIKFAVGFYDALGAGRDYEDAYEFGCTAIDLESIPESATPVLKSKSAKCVPINSAIALENPEGQVPLESPFYIKRSPVENDCYEEVLRDGALIRIKAPRQMGKSSLMSRVLDYGSKQGYESAYLNFQSADAEYLSSLEMFLQWFCASVTDSLNLPEKLGDYWKGVLGSKNKCTNYFQRYLLKEIDKPIVLGLDEVDEIFKHPTIATDFFGLLRAWHERAKNDPDWQKLRLIIVHSKEVYVPLNINQSPFNVGLPVELPELNQEQVQDLVQRHGLSWSNSQVQQLIMLVGGHPYLVRMALYQIARERTTLDKLEQVAPTEAGPYNDHLRRHLLNLQEDEELLAALKQVVLADEAVNVGTTEAFKLRSMGLVKFQGNKIMPLCNLYRKYFCDRLEL